LAKATSSHLPLTWRDSCSEVHLILFLWSAGRFAPNKMSIGSDVFAQPTCGPTDAGTIDCNSLRLMQSTRLMNRTDDRLTVDLQNVFVPVHEDAEHALACCVERTVSLDVRPTALRRMFNISPDPRHQCVQVQFHRTDKHTSFN